MDDIAREMGMSKKTIYKHVRDKSELVKVVLKSHLAEEMQQVEQTLHSSPNAVDSMIKLLEYFLTQIREFNPSVLYDLQKYYPESWNLFNEYRYGFFQNIIEENIKNGMKQGYYRSDLDASIISKIYIRSFEVMLDQELFPQKKFQFFMVYKEYLNYHLRGILSPQGLKFLEQQNFFKHNA